MENVNQTTVVENPLKAITEDLGLKGLFNGPPAPSTSIMPVLFHNGALKFSTKAKQVFKIGRRCPKCSGPCTRSYCEYCLKKMAEEWKAESDRRRKHGQCCKCERRGVMIKGKRSVFCRFHREENRARSQAWQQANGKNRWELRKALGVCARSPKHGPVEKPHAYCAGCRKRERDTRVRP